MRPLSVGVDLDGPGYCFPASVDRARVALDGAESMLQPGEEVSSWEFYEAWGMDLGGFLDLCHRGADAGIIFTGPTHPGFADALCRLKAAGCQVHIKTDRSFGSTPKVSEDATRAWLAQHCAPYDTLTFTSDKMAGPECDVFIEDKPSNYDALRAAGVECFLVDKPWNTGHAPADHVVSSIGAFADLICGRLNYCPDCKRSRVGCACGLTFAEKIRTVGMTLGDFRAVRS